MRAVVVLLSILFLCNSVKSFHSPDQSQIDWHWKNITILIEKVVQIVILYAESVVKGRGTIPLVPNKTMLSFDTANIIKGAVSCNKLSLYGLENLQARKDYIKFQLNTTNQSLLLGLRIAITGGFGIKIDDYFSDIGLINQLPIYGKGNITLEMNSIDIDIDTKLSYGNRLNISYLAIDPVLSLAKINLTGFWNNDELSVIISEALTLLADVLIVFWDFERHCISCLFSTLIESVVNDNLGNITADLQIRCGDTCRASTYPFIKTAFNQNLTEYLQNIPEKDIIKLIETAQGYLTDQINRLL